MIKSFIVTMLILATAVCCNATDDVRCNSYTCHCDSGHDWTLRFSCETSGVGVVTLEADSQPIASKLYMAHYDSASGSYTVVMFLPESVRLEMVDGDLVHQGGVIFSKD